MKTLHYQRIEGDVAQRIRAILADRPVRIALHGEDARIGEDEMLARWCGEGRAAAGTRRLAVRCGELGQIVGALALVDAELSYFVARPLWGRGYGGALVRQFLVDDVARHAPLSARVVRSHVASRRILESAGFGETGLVRRARGLPSVVTYLRRPDPSVSPTIPAAGDSPRLAAHPPRTGT